MPKTLDIIHDSKPNMEVITLPNESTVVRICGRTGTVMKIQGQAASVKNDFNGDGISDVLFRNTLNGRWFMNLMDETGNVQSTFYVSGLTTNLNQKLADTGDFNGDGISDVLLRNILNGRSFMNLMDDTGNVQSTFYVSGLSTNLNQEPILLSQP